MTVLKNELKFLLANPMQFSFYNYITGPNQAEQIHIFRLLIKKFAEISSILLKEYLISSYSHRTQRDGETFFANLLKLTLPILLVKDPL